MENEYHLKGKYANDLLEGGEHAVKGQTLVEERVQTKYVPSYEQYVNRDIQFNKQYNSFYEIRLKQIRPLLKAAAQKKWGSSIQVMDEIRHAKENEKCVIIGTIYKELSLFQSILNEKTSSSFNPQLIGTQFLPKKNNQPCLTQEGDSITLEDHFTRILIKNLNEPVVTGVVLALLGIMDSNGDFEVTDTCYVNDTIESIPQEFTDSTNKDDFILCASGLSVGSTIPLRLSLLFDFIGSQIGFVEDTRVSSRICRILLAGNNVNLNREPFQHIRQNAKDIQEDMKCIENLDLLLSQVLPTVPVTVIPGATDVSSILIPQQPIHPSSFSHSIGYTSLECATNPYCGIIDGKRVMATAGQNVADITRQVATPMAPLDIMLKTLQWGYLFPTNPNTCPGIPYDVSDPFIISEIPDVYVVGNQEKLEIRQVSVNGKKVMLIALPSFNKTGVAVMVNVKTMKVSPISFDTSEFESYEGETEVMATEEEDAVIDENIENEEE